MNSPLGGSEVFDSTFTFESGENQNSVTLAKGLSLAQVHRGTADGVADLHYNHFLGIVVYARNQGSSVRVLPSEYRNTFVMRVLCEMCVPSVGCDRSNTSSAK